MQLLTFKLLCMKKFNTFLQNDKVQELLLVAIGAAIVTILVMVA